MECEEECFWMLFICKLNSTESTEQKASCIIIQLFRMLKKVPSQRLEVRYFLIMTAEKNECPVRIYFSRMTGRLYIIPYLGAFSILLLF